MRVYNEEKQVVNHRMVISGPAVSRVVFSFHFTKKTLNFPLSVFMCHVAVKLLKYRSIGYCNVISHMLQDE